MIRVRGLGRSGRRCAAPVAAAAVAVLLLSGCSGGGDALSLGSLQEKAAKIGGDGAADCPLAYDLAGAAKTAGVSLAAGPGDTQGEEPAVTAEDGREAPEGSAWAANPGALVTCTFHLGQEDVEVHTVATEKVQALSVLAPVAQRAAGIGIDDLRTFLKDAAAAKKGVPVVAKSGNVAAARLGLDGSGDASLLLTVGDSGKSGLGAEQVGALAKALAGQLG
ncbi:hypothetical protein ACFXPT_25520 [Streptomyces goshikiensis]|uniref:hypothetical protein n=1 Tax=Streptomyces goshikiensis TaxID=1942 RepID=UPI0036C865C1